MPEPDPDVAINAVSRAGATASVHPPGSVLAQSGAALAVRTVIVMMAGLARVSLVARALGPRELGLFALLTVTVEAARAVSTLSPISVLVQRERITTGFVTTYWVFNIAQGLIIAAIVLAAYPASQVFHPGRSQWILHALVAFAAFVSAWASPGRVVAERNVRFGRIAATESIGALIDLVVVVALAFLLRSALALAIGAVARAFVEVALSFFFFPTRVGFQIDAEARAEYFRAGKHVLLMSVASYVALFGDNAVIGALLGSQALGLYVVAYRLAEIPFSMLFAISKRLLFPYASRLQSEKAKLRTVVMDSLSLQMMFLAGTGVGFCVFADVFVPLFFGAKFRESVMVLRVLVLLTLGRGAAIMLAQVLLSAGRFRDLSWLTLLEVSLFVPGVVMGAHFLGLVGAALGAGLSYVVASVLRAAALCRIEGYRGTGLTGALGWPVLAAGVAAMTAWLGRSWGASVWLGVVLYGACYVFAVALAERARVRRIYKAVLSSG
jgi:O-antigen/teichoic acid export membrane protein